MEIGFFQTAFLGDLLLSVPTLRRLRALYPKAKIHLYCRQGLGDFFMNLPFVDQAYEVNKKARLSRELFVKDLERENFDLFICAHYSPRTHRWMKKVKAKKKVGFSLWWNRGYFDHRVTRNLKYPDALRQMQLLLPIDSEMPRLFQEVEGLELPYARVPDFASMTLEPSFWQKQRETLSIETPEKYVCIAPGSVWRTKRWRPHGFNEIGRAFYDRGYEVYFVGSPEESELCCEIAGAIGAKSVAGKISLWETACLMSGAKLVVSNDSGAQHLASLSGVPSVSIFGPTVLSLGYQPWQNNARVVEKAMDCRPCGKHGHDECPLGTHACMEDLSDDEVLNEIKSLLSL